MTLQEKEEVKKHEQFGEIKKLLCVDSYFSSREKSYMSLKTDYFFKAWEILVEIDYKISTISIAITGV